MRGSFVLAHNSRCRGITPEKQTAALIPKKIFDVNGKAEEVCSILSGPYCKYTSSNSRAQSAAAPCSWFRMRIACSTL